LPHSKYKGERRKGQRERIQGASLDYDTEQHLNLTREREGKREREGEIGNHTQEFSPVESGGRRKGEGRVESAL
jgi:hypothetical protein